jgi:hypothetical protein
MLMAWRVSPYFWEANPSFGGISMLAGMITSPAGLAYNWLIAVMEIYTLFMPVVQSLPCEAALAEASANGPVHQCGYF